MSEKKGLRIGIYGGAFDPVHYTHLRAAQAVTTYLLLDHLIWVPTGMAWHKQANLTLAEHRVNMLKLAFEPFDAETKDKWSVSTLEIERRKPSYSIETVLQLQGDLILPDAQWYLAIGTDQFNVLHTWRDWPELLRRVSLAVVPRANVPLQVKKEVLEQAKWTMVPLEPSCLSSTQIREALRSAGKSVQVPQEQTVKQLTEFVPPLVAEYIVQHELYR